MTLVSLMSVVLPVVCIFNLCWRLDCFLRMAVLIKMDVRYNVIRVVQMLLFSIRILSISVVLQTVSYLYPFTALT